MDEMQLPPVIPVVFDIFQLPNRIRGSPSWLNRAKIDADNRAILTIVCHFFGPNTGPAIPVPMSKNL
jgi:hypothetical protein